MIILRLEGRRPCRHCDCISIVHVFVRCLSSQAHLHNSHNLTADLLIMLVWKVRVDVVAIDTPTVSLMKQWVFFSINLPQARNDRVLQPVM